MNGKGERVSKGSYLLKGTCTGYAVYVIRATLQGFCYFHILLLKFENAILATPSKIS